jgi:hypothetical protein
MKAAGRQDEGRDRPSKPGLEARLMVVQTFPSGSLDIREEAPMSDPGTMTGKPLIERWLRDPFRPDHHSTVCSTA